VRTWGAGVLRPCGEKASGVEPAYCRLLRHDTEAKRPLPFLRQDAEGGRYKGEQVWRRNLDEISF